MVQREVDSTLINKIANHPSVWPFIASVHGGKPADFSHAFPMVESNGVILTNGEDAAMVFERTGERAWQVCTMFQDTCRGAKARKAGAEMREYMAPYADVIFGLVPKDFPHAAKFYTDLGAEQVPHVKIGDDLFLPTESEDMFALRVQ